MAKITEKDIEQYIRFPREMDAEKRGEVKQALKSSKELRELVDFFKDYEQYFSKLTAESSVNVIELQSFKSKESGNSHPNRLILAAQTKQQAPQLETVATLASEENDTVVRILNETETDYCHIHVLSELLDDEDLSILSLADFDVDLIIKEKGRLRFKPDFDIQGYDWDTSSLTLYLPVERLTVSLEKRISSQQMEQNEGDEHILTLKDREGNLQGRIRAREKTAPEITRVIVRGSQTGPYIARVTDDTFLVPLDDGDKSINVWLFE